LHALQYPPSPCEVHAYVSPAILPSAPSPCSCTADGNLPIDTSVAAVPGLDPSPPVLLEFLSGRSRGVSHACSSCASRNISRGSSVPSSHVSAHYKKTQLVSEFSLCVSRACLGKMIAFILKWRKKWRVLTCHTAPTFACSKSSCEKRASLVLSEVLSLCLSRACLGKSIVFGLNTAQKEACFLFFVAPRSSSRRGSVRKCRSLVKCFP